MIRKVLKFPNKNLNKTANVIKDKEFNTPKLRKLIADMMDTMKALGGVGLAAPQIGNPKRAIIVKDNNKPLYVMFNPEIISKSGNEGDSLEGCLSVPMMRGLVTRDKEITVQFQTISGETKKVIALDQEAFIVQHEIDHLNGVLFLDVAHTLQ